MPSDERRAMKRRPTLLLVSCLLGPFSIACGESEIGGGGENDSVSGAGPGAGTDTGSASGSGAGGPSSGSGGSSAGSGGDGGTHGGMPLACGQAKRTETRVAPADWSPVLGLGVPVAGNGL